MADITKLDLSNNKLRNLKGMECLVRLEQVNLSRNKIESLSDLDSLRLLANLKSVNLKHNPICDSINYPRMVLEFLPRLTRLDGHDACVDSHHFNNRPNSAKNDKNGHDIDVIEILRMVDSVDNSNLYNSINPPALRQTTFYDNAKHENDDDLVILSVDKDNVNDSADFEVDYALTCSTENLMTAFRKALNGMDFSDAVSSSQLVPVDQEQEEDDENVLPAKVAKTPSRPPPPRPENSNDDHSVDSIAISEKSALVEDREMNDSHVLNDATMLQIEKLVQTVSDMQTSIDQGRKSQLEESNKRFDGIETKLTELSSLVESTRISPDDLLKPILSDMQQLKESISSQTSERDDRISAQLSNVSDGINSLTGTYVRLVTATERALLMLGNQIEECNKKWSEESLMHKRNVSNIQAAVTRLTSGK